MRWEPAENAGLEKDWQPRDSDSWLFSFGYRAHGTVPTSPSDVNNRRYKLAHDSALSYPVKVLDNVEPRYEIYCQRGINWSDPDSEKYIEKIDSATHDSVVTCDTIIAPDSADCRRMYVVVNVRRNC